MMNEKEASNLHDFGKEIDSTISSLEQIHENQQAVTGMPIAHELRRVTDYILTQRIDDGSAWLADVASAVPFEQVETRLTELQSKEPTLTDSTAEDLHEFHEQLLAIVPEAKGKISEEEAAELERLANPANILTESEAREMVLLQDIDAAMERPIKVPGMFERLYPTVEYIDVFPRPEIDPPKPQPTKHQEVKYIGRDNHFHKNVVEFLEDQPLLKTITLEEMFSIIPEHVVEESIRHQQKYNEQRGINSRRDSLLRSRLGHYLRTNTDNGTEVAEALCERGIVIQRGARSIAGMGGTPLLIIRLLSAEQAKDHAHIEMIASDTHTDSWGAPTIIGGNEAALQLETKDEPAEIAKEAIKQVMLAPLLRREFVKYFLASENIVASIDDIHDHIQNTVDLAEHSKNIKTSVRTILDTILRDGQKAVVRTNASFEEAGIAVEWGYKDSVIDNKPVRYRVFRMQHAHADERKYPASETVGDGVLSWEGVFGTFTGDKLVESAHEAVTAEEITTDVSARLMPTEAELLEIPDVAEEAQAPVQEISAADTLTPEVSPEAEPEAEIDPLIHIPITTGSIIRWLDSKEILSATHSWKSRVKITPATIRANGHGEVSTKKLLRVLKKHELLVDDREICVKDLIIAGLLPTYGGALTKPGNDRNIILALAEQTINDYYEERSKQKSRQVRRPRR